MAGAIPLLPMSAILALCAVDAVHILTDAATTATRDGRILALAPKQLILRNGTVIAGVGFWPPVRHFARLVHELATFDEMTRAAPDLWAQVRAAMPDDAREVFGATVLAGWSEENQRLELHVIEWPEKITFNVGGYC